MYPDVVELSEFYESEVGGLARRLIRTQLQKLWETTPSSTVLGLGYATPYLRSFTETASRVLAFMPAQQGVTWWPREGPNLTALTEETSLPLEDASVDRIIMAHALENTEHIADLLHEAWRVLAGNGRMIVIVPHRGGFWTLNSKNPFGFGFSFSSGHIKRLLTHNRFQIERQRRALFVPPFLRRVFAPSADTIERYGNIFFPAIAGVLLIEVSKQVYARPLREKVPAKKPVLIPMPDFAAPSPTAGRG
jgi:SAM-dependent methyltransferase